MSETPVRLYTTKEAAEILNIGPEWLRRQVRAHTVKCRRMGRAIRFSDADIDAIIESREQPILRKPGGQRSKL